MPASLEGNYLSRRNFLKTSATSFLALLALSKTSPTFADSEIVDETTPTWGRITIDDVNMYDQPSLEGALVRTLWADLVLPITKVVIGSGKPSYNPTWYEINKEGYVHSGHVQPVEIRLNTPVTTIPECGALAEITVPFSDAVWNPLSEKKMAYRLYYSSTHWIQDALTDHQGVVWYQVLEDFYSYKYFVNASHLRLIKPGELAPISPEIPAEEKKLVVHLRKQSMAAYEGDTLVQQYRCSSGVKYSYHFWTPAGKYTIDYKRPSRHMVRHAKSSPFHYDLPGVPWVSTFNSVGMAFHGTYWHNDFGRPASDGCINLTSSAAKWVYRWTLPQVPFEEDFLFKPGGTKVEITLE